MTADQFSTIQKRIDRFTVPSDIGRIPYKIASGFSSFTADQFKNWVVYYSLVAMRGILMHTCSAGHTLLLLVGY